MQRFRGGLVFKALRLLYLSTLGLRVIQRKKKWGSETLAFHASPSPNPIVTPSRTAQRSQLLHTNVQRFRGGLVFKAHRLCVSLNCRLESNREEEELPNDNNTTRLRFSNRGVSICRCRANMAHVGQSRQDSGHGFQVNVLETVSRYFIVARKRCVEL